jgi:hypothetical protein
MCESFAESGRATVSVPPPGGNGTTTRTGFDGQSCAAACAANTRNDASHAARVCIDPSS